MTDREKAVVMAYTGACMLSGDKFQIFHKYIEDIMGRPVYTHELADKTVEDEIKEKAKPDFIALCAEQEPKTGHWIYKNHNWHCSECDETPKTLGYVGDADFMREHFKFCNHCGCRMSEVGE